MLATAPLLMSCGGTGRATDCAWARPIIVSRSQDALSDATAEQILVHNKAGAELCGWRK